MTAPCIAGPCSSRRTSRSERGDGCSTTPTLRRPSSTGFSRAAGTSNSGARPTGRATPDLTSGAAPSQDQRHRPEFPENTGQSFRNPQRVRPCHRSLVGVGAGADLEGSRRGECAPWREGGSEMAELALGVLRNAVAGSAAAFRCRRRLLPAGGAGDKVFPPTFAGAVYAVEQRRIPGRTEPVTCVLLDSVQSQANRMELALQEAVDAGRITIPLVVVDFSDHDPTGDLEADEAAGRLIDKVGQITSLQVPHRLADAILRDSELDGPCTATSWPRSNVGRRARRVQTVRPVERIQGAGHGAFRGPA